MANNHAARPRKKHGVLKLLLVLLLLAAVCAGVAFWQAKTDINGAPAGESVTVPVSQGSSVATIARQLKEQGVIKYPRLFRWYVGQKGAASKLQYGDFTLEKGMSYDALIEALSVYAEAENVTVTFPEGLTAIAIAQKMEDAGLCTAEEFLEEANTGDFSEYKFWQYVPDDEDAPDRFMKCEGYLFPDTYNFLKDDTVHNYVATFYAHFNSVVTDDMYKKLDEQGMTLPELVTLASLVQEEAGNDQDSNVAQVFRNRLAEGSPYPLLQSNTSSYIQNDADNNYLYNWVAPYYGGWDKIPANIVAAYDTYSHEGLPAGPISNPGAEAIKAALDPKPDEEVKDCYFFVTDLSGHYYYGKTLAEHNANVAEAAKVNKGMAAGSSAAAAEETSSSRAAASSEAASSGKASSSSKAGSEKVASSSGKAASSAGAASSSKAESSSKAASSKAASSKVVASSKSAK